ncbi:MAG: DUF1080 domain-containing protein [Candidatus Hydrogenedentes bacterium]|jgi:hypothetical protein|nr:DUF1080 domain-containing protein [Candidatus Hydrogenedentota bacterium]
MKRNMSLIAFTALLCFAFAHGETTEPAMEALPMELIPLLMDIPSWTPLFEDDLSNAQLEPGGWSFENGVLTTRGKGDIWTQASYGNFMLNVEYKCEDNTNSGIFFRCTDIKNSVQSALEIQILQNNDDYKNPKHHCGGLFDCKEPARLLVKKAGEWNHCVVVAKDKNVYVLLNGEQVLGLNLDLWTEAHKNPDGTPNKYKNAYKDMALEGVVGLQDHGQPVSFRNLRIKELD